VWDGTSSRRKYLVLIVFHSCIHVNPLFPIEKLNKLPPGSIPTPLVLILVLNRLRTVDFSDVLSSSPSSVGTFTVSPKQKAEIFIGVPVQLPIDLYNCPIPIPDTTLKAIVILVFALDYTCTGYDVLYSRSIPLLSLVCTAEKECECECECELIVDWKQWDLLRRATMRAIRRQQQHPSQIQHLHAPRVRNCCTRFSLVPTRGLGRYCRP
jgi:hypothetical protein